MALAFVNFSSYWHQNRRQKSFNADRPKRCIRKEQVWGGESGLVILPACVPKSLQVLLRTQTASKIYLGFENLFQSRIIYRTLFLVRITFPLVFISRRWEEESKLYFEWQFPWGNLQHLKQKEFIDDSLIFRRFFLSSYRRVSCYMNKYTSLKSKQHVQKNEKLTSLLDILAENANRCRLIVDSATQN